MKFNIISCFISSRRQSASTNNVIAFESSMFHVSFTAKIMLIIGTEQKLQHQTANMSSVMNFHIFEDRNFTPSGFITSMYFFA